MPAKPPKIATMEDFAAAIGMSRPTVSKYFHDPASVRDTTRAKIEAGLKRTGFRPNIFAVNLKRRRSKIIGLIVPDPADPFYMTLAQRIEAEATAAGYLALVLSSSGKAETEARAIETISALNVAGAVIAPLGETSRRSRLKVLGRETPLVFIDAPLDDQGPFVGTNNQQSIALITEYLCRSDQLPTYFDTPIVNNNAIDRRSAYVATMDRLGFEPRFAPVAPSRSFDFEQASFDAAARILRDEAFPTRTLLCANDRVAFGVLAALYQAGKKVGFERDCEFRVAGHDNQRLSAYTCPPLTTVAQDCDAMARAAFAMLLARIDDGLAAARDTRVLIDGTLVLRKSA